MVLTEVTMHAASRMLVFFFSSRRRHTRCSRDWSSDVCSSDLGRFGYSEFDEKRCAAASPNLAGNSFHEGDVGSFAAPGLQLGNFLFFASVPVITNGKRAQRGFTNGIAA